MNAAEMKRAAGRALELGLTAVLTVPVVLVILAAAAAVVWLWASRMLPQPVYEPETFTQARWEELDDRGVLVDSLLEQYDGLEGMDLAEVQALLGEHPYNPGGPGGGDVPGRLLHRRGPGEQRPGGGHGAPVPGRGSDPGGV